MLDYLKTRIEGTVRFTRRVMASFSQHGNVRHAAALSYYTLFSMFPLMLFLVYIASLFFPSEASRQLLAAYLEKLLPGWRHQSGEDPGTNLGGTRLNRDRCRAGTVMGWLFDL